MIFMSPAREEITLAFIEQEILRELKKFKVERLDDRVICDINATIQFVVDYIKYGDSRSEVRFLAERISFKAETQSEKGIILMPGNDFTQQLKTRVGNYLEAQR